MPVFNNQATLSYSGGVINSNITTGQITQVLSVTKTAISTGYMPGESVAYVVSLVNTGSTELTGLTVTDSLGGYPVDDATVYPLTYTEGSLHYYISGALQATPEVEAGPPLVIGGIDIPAGANAMLIYEAGVTEFAPLGQDACFTNTVTVTGPVGAEAEASICMTCAPQLTLSKAVSPDTVSPGDAITYTFTITNTGCEATAEDEVVITDTFDPILRDLTVTLNGTALTEPDSYTYDETTGDFSTVAGAITVPAATFSQNEAGAWVTAPGVTVLTVTGTI